MNGEVEGETKVFRLADLGRWYYYQEGGLVVVGDRGLILT